MPPVTTDAIVLSTLRYGETSKIARLATRDLGLQSAIAKGALRPRSRFAAALHGLSEGQATLALSRASDLHTLTQFDARSIRIGLAARLDRFAAASVLSEVMLRFAPAAAHPPSYDLFRDALEVLEAAPAAAVETLGLRAVWRLIAVLGFAPVLAACVRDGTPLAPDEPALFFTGEGGMLCRTCARGVDGNLLQPRDRADLAAFLDPALPLPALDDRHLAAHRRLVDRYLRHHLGEGAVLPALAFWLQRDWAKAVG